MMGMPNYPSKAALKRGILAGDVHAVREFQETSIFGAEYNGEGSYVVVMGPAEGPRKSFGKVTVDSDGLITGVK